jgi:hypothetical protein
MNRTPSAREGGVAKTCHLPQVRGRAVGSIAGLSTTLEGGRIGDDVSAYCMKGGRIGDWGAQARSNFVVIRTVFRSRGLY